MKLYKHFQYDYGYTRYIFLKNFLDDNNIRFPEYSYFEDPPFLVKAMILANEFYAIKEDTYCCRLGHKTRRWDKKQACDLVRGLYDVLMLSNKYGLYKLHSNIINRIEYEYIDIIFNSLEEGNIELLKLIVKFNNNINEKYINMIRADKVDNKYIIRPLRIMMNIEKDSSLVTDNLSYGIGRTITWLPRKIGRTYLYYRNNGLTMTLKKVGEKIGILRH